MPRVARKPVPDDVENPCPIAQLGEDRGGEQEVDDRGDAHQLRRSHAAARIRH